MRSAHNFGASFIATIGERYRKQGSDTTDATKHIPLFHYDTLEDFISSLPKNCEVVRCEVDGKNDIRTFKHPESCVYIFGGEDRSVPEIPLSIGVKIDTPYCLNLATTASLFMFHRTLN